MKKVKNEEDLISRSEFAKESIRQFAGYFSDIGLKINDFKNTLKNTIDTGSPENLNDNSRLPLLRPPGAIEKEKFISSCDGCEECANACEYRVIKIITDENDEKPTPIIIPSENPCYMCGGFPCINACKKGALLKKNRKKGIGYAHIVKKRCFAHNEQICDYCFDRCPEQNRAIKMKDGIPVIFIEKCNGCGMCEYICPAPDKGVKILPKKNKL